MQKVSIEEADKLSGVKVDRRVKQYWTTDNKKPCETTNAILFKNAKFTGVCTGCSDDSEYSNQSIGCGCHECGGTGKRVTNFPLPVYFPPK